MVSFSLPTFLLLLPVWWNDMEADDGNDTGEIAAIANCTSILTDPTGRYNFTASQAQSAFSSLSLYTNAESCPMCASAIRWAGFKEYIYGTSIDTLVQRGKPSFLFTLFFRVLISELEWFADVMTWLGWGQIRISSYEIFKESGDLPSKTKLIANVAVNETDPFFLWQYDPAYPCPADCQRGAQGGCTVV